MVKRAFCEIAKYNRTVEHTDVDAAAMVAVRRINSAPETPSVRLATRSVRRQNSVETIPGTTVLVEVAAPRIAGRAQFVWIVGVAGIVQADARIAVKVVGVKTTNSSGTALDTGGVISFWRACSFANGDRVGGAVGT